MDNRKTESDTVSRLLFLLVVFFLRLAVFTGFVCVFFNVTVYLFVFFKNRVHRGKLRADSV